MQEVLLAFKQLEELEVCVWLGANDCRGAITKEVFALLRGALEGPNTTMCRAFGCNVSESGPGRSLAQISSQGLLSKPETLMAKSQVLQDMRGRHIRRT